jgi:hypothetical protein
MTRFTSIVSTLALVPTSLVLASPALASTVEDVKANFGLTTAETERYDLNCDGVIGVPDVRIAGNVTQIHSSPDFNPVQAVRDNFGDTREDLGRAFPHEADLNGDCTIGVPDLNMGDDTLSALGQAQTQDLFAVLASHWGTEGDSPVDFNCDGKVGVADWELVGQMVSAQHAPHYDPLTAATMAFGTQVGDEGYHPAADDGDCKIGVQDLANAAGEGAVDQ